MRYALFVITAMILMEPAMARDYSYQIRQAQRSCEIEKTSMLRDRHGTPSCQRVRDLIELQRLEIEARVSRQTGQPMPDRTMVIINPPRHDRDRFHHRR